MSLEGMVGQEKLFSAKLGRLLAGDSGKRLYWGWRAKKEIRWVKLSVNSLEMGKVKCKVWGGRERQGEMERR